MLTRRVAAPPRQHVLGTLGGVAPQGRQFAMPAQFTANLNGVIAPQNGQQAQLASTTWYDNAGQQRETSYMQVQRYERGSGMSVAGSRSSYGGGSGGVQPSGRGSIGATNQFSAFGYGGGSSAGAALPIATGSSLAGAAIDLGIVSGQQVEYGGGGGGSGGAYGARDRTYASHRIDGRGMSFGPGSGGVGDPLGGDVGIAGASLGGIGRRQSVGELRSAYLRQQTSMHGDLAQMAQMGVVPPHPGENLRAQQAKRSGRGLPSTSSMFRRGSHVVYPLRASKKR
jgi:hypothetical protein